MDTISSQSISSTLGTFMRVSFTVNNKPLQDAHHPRPAGLEQQADSKASPGTDSLCLLHKREKSGRSLRSQIILKPKTCLDGLFGWH